MIVKLIRLASNPRRLGAITFAASFAVSLSACNPKIIEETTAAETSQVAVAVTSDPKTFNPVLSAERPNIFPYTFEGLVEQNPVTGEVEPALAESWEVSDDGVRYVFTLREGLKWSDGEPLTAEDVVFSFNDLYLNEEIPTNSRDGLRIGQSGAFPTVRQLDKRRVEFTLPEPFAPFLSSLGQEILPKHVLEKTVQQKGPDGKPLFLTTWGVDTPPEEIVVNGPYMLEDFDTSERVIFKRNPYYSRKDEQGNQLPYIDRVVWEVVENTDTSLLQFRSGGTDGIAVSPAYFSLLKREEDKGDFTIYNGGPDYGTRFLMFNLNKGKRNGSPLVDPVKSRWFNNVNFRRAVAYAIDRQQMINNIYRGLGEAQNSPISVQSPYYYDGLEGYDYDPEKAKEILRSEGFKYNSKGQLLDAEGNRVRFTLLTSAGSAAAEALGAQIKQDLAKIGIQVDFNPIAWNTLTDKLSNSLDWDAALLALSGGNEPHGGASVWYPDGNLHMFNQKPQPGRPPLEGREVADWERRIAELYIQGSQELDEEKRKEIYAEAQRLVEEHLPFIYLVNPLSLAAVRDRIEGVDYSALGGAFWNIEQLNVSGQQELTE